MTKRLDYFLTSPLAMDILLEQESYLQRQFSTAHSVTTTIWELVKLRVSQINQCAYCIDMHSKDALKLGESPARIYGLSAWIDMPFYSETERSALAWAELITSGQHVAEEHYQRALDGFGAQGLVDLTIAINAINGWNRIARTFKPEVGSYKTS